MRHSQMLFLQRHGSNLNRADTLNVLDQGPAQQASLAVTRMFSTFTTSARIVNSVTKPRLFKQHTQTHLEDAGQQDEEGDERDLTNLQIPGGDELEPTAYGLEKKRQSTGYKKQPPTVAWSTRSATKLSDAGRPAQATGGRSQRPASGHILQQKASRPLLEQTGNMQFHEELRQESDKSLARITESEHQISEDMQD